MQMLIHLGLNKCASSFVQQSLHGARHDLARLGVWYPRQDGPPCQYGLSRDLGFGPDDASVTPVRLERIVAQAHAMGCARVIISSEYLSLYNPAATRRLCDQIDMLGVDAEFCLFSRDVTAWIRSLFNQYVRTVDGAGRLPDLNAFVDQVLRNRAVDIARRYHQWADCAGDARVRHYRLSEGEQDQVLTPFSEFAGWRINPAVRSANKSVSRDRLFEIGELRGEPPCRARTQKISALIAGAPANLIAPPGYLTISPDRMARLEHEIIAPYRALPGTCVAKPDMAVAAAL